MNILGIDIGGSGIKGAVIDTTSGRLLTARQRLATPQPATPDAIAVTVKQLVDDQGWQGAVGCGFPATVRHGIVNTAANIDASWIKVNAEARFSAMLGRPVSVINDADAAGMAEVRFGIARQRRGVVVMVTIGTGLGTALFIDGRLVPNTEFGHLQLKGRLAEHYAADSARRREDLSWKKWGKRLNRYLKRLEFLLSPDLLVLGGGVSQKFDRFAPYLTLDTEVQPAATLNHAGIIGAALAAEQRIKDNPASDREAQASAQQLSPLATPERTRN